MICKTLSKQELPKYLDCHDPVDREIILLATHGKLKVGIVSTNKG